MKNLKQLLYSNEGRVFISILLGLGIASLFRSVCKKRKCTIFKKPDDDEVKDKTFKHDGKCYKYELQTTKCDKSKQNVKFS
jgi:hypothetical protein